MLLTGTGMSVLAVIALLQLPHEGGGVMSIVSGLILEASGPGHLSPVRVVYGLFGLFGVAVAAWIQFSSSPVQSAA